MESAENKEETKFSGSRFNQEIQSKAVRAGKRTYFFDVKTTRNDEYYLTITESKKIFTNDGDFHFEKHKLFLYKEDFEKFTEGLEEIIQYIRQNQPEEAIDSIEDNQEVIAETEPKPVNVEIG